MDADNLQNRRILVGVTGGIAAYKTAELVRYLRQASAEVQVVMSPAATRFITSLTLQALSGKPIRTSLWEEDAEAAMGHIELARWADLIIIAPATADFLAKLSAGRADDLLATLCLATEAPVVVAPAMNRVMWRHPATQDNIAVIGKRGIKIWGPACGDQACGESGPGRMLEPKVIFEHILSLFGSGILAGVKVMITAGPTREALDPVRFLSNRSSGKMGYALAQAALEAGAQVTLVSGPVALTPPACVEVVGVESAQEMYQAVMERISDQAIFIAAAAVADYRPVRPASRKIKKDAERQVLELTRTPDILATVASLKHRPFTVGFAAETNHLETCAKAKLEGKGLDMIAANRVGPGVGFEVDENALLILWPGGEKRLDTAPKPELARKFLELIAEHYAEKNTV